MVNLAESNFLAHDFTVNGIQTFYARFKFGGNSGFDKFGLDCGLDFLEKLFVARRLVADFLLQGEESFRLEIAERQVLEFAAYHAHSEAKRDRRRDVQGFSPDALLLFEFQLFELPPSLKPVRRLSANTQT